MKFSRLQSGYFTNTHNPTRLVGYLYSYNENFITLNDMGSDYSKYVSQCLERIYSNLDKYDIISTDIQNFNGVSFILVCRNDATEKILAELKNYADNPYRLNEPCGLEYHFYNNSGPSYYAFSRKNNQFWLDLDNDWFGFFGGDDRQILLTKLINKIKKGRNIK